jgi:adenylate cyclase
VSTTSRKLAAILSADVAGYSRLMAEDEQATLATLTDYRAAMSGLITGFRGRVIDAPGDALLAEFPSAVEAVQCAVEIQQGLSQRNAQLPESRRMLFRIGVNLGDVIEQDGALYGDGVNIAARLEALAQPGGVCISGTVFDQVEGKVIVPFRFAGEQSVKNIAQPVRAYFVGTPTQRHRSAIAKKAVLIAVATVLACGIGVGVWLTTRISTSEPGASAEHLLAMPKGPVVAVLPFTNMSGDPGQDYFSDGLSEDIITELARFREVHVLARNTTFQYKGQSVDVPAVGRKLGAQYVLEGSVRRAENQLRISVQLIDVASGGHIWAERFDRKPEDVFAVQDEVTRQIVGAIAGGAGGLIHDSVMRMARTKKFEQMEAYELVLQARIGPYSQDWYDKGKAALERAIALDPTYARARDEYAWLRMMCRHAESFSL